MSSLTTKDSWFKESKLTWFEQFLINIVKCGEIPRHVAIIMDGNRRFAKKKHLDQSYCYNLGFEIVKNTLKYSVHLGIEEITIFAFSIENFKRDPIETEILMDLATYKFGLLLNEKDKLIESDVCIRFIGNLELLPVKLQKLMSEVMLETKNHKSKFLNICVAYTSSFELSTAAFRICRAHNLNIITANEITKNNLNISLLTNESRTNPDLLIRTSGEIRLSDFLLWQCNYSNLAFANVLWPECTFIEFCKLILKYQLDKKFNHNSKLDRVIKSNRELKIDFNPNLKQYVDSELEKHLKKI